MPGLRVNGTTLECDARGSGEPLVLVHGSASDSRTWRAQQDALAARFRVIAYSRRYHWPNQPIAAGADYAMAEHVDDLAALLRALDAAPAHLVGHSYGAFLCLLLAIREPDLVRTLVLEEAPVLTLFTSSPPRPREIVRLLFTRPRTAIAIVAFGARGIAPATAAAARGDAEEAMRIFGSAVLGREAFRRLSPERQEQMRANFIPAELLGSGLAPLDERDLRGVRVPTLLVGGSSSPALFHRLDDRLLELLPACERIEIAGASHIVHEDDAPAYVAAVSAYLAGPRQGQSPIA